MKVKIFTIFRKLRILTGGITFLYRLDRYVPPTFPGGEGGVLPIWKAKSNVSSNNSYFSLTEGLRFKR